MGWGRGVGQGGWGGGGGRVGWGWVGGGLGVGVGLLQKDVESLGWTEQNPGRFVLEKSQMRAPKNVILKAIGFQLSKGDPDPICLS